MPSTLGFPVGQNELINLQDTPRLTPLTYAKNNSTGSNHCNLQDQSHQSVPRTLLHNLENISDLADNKPTRHDMAAKLPMWRHTAITHSFTTNPAFHSKTISVKIPSKQARQYNSGTTSSVYMYV